MNKLIYRLIDVTSSCLSISQLLSLARFFMSLSQGLRLNQTLLYLSLANNNIGDVGASYLAQVHLQTLLQCYSIIGYSVYIKDLHTHSYYVVLCRCSAHSL